MTVFPPASVLAAPVLRTRLPNGITLILIENRAVDVVAARVFLRGGSQVEAPAQWGVSGLMASVLTKGTQSRDARAIAMVVESMGASLGVDSSPDYLEMSLKSVSGDFPALFALVSELLRLPSFPDHEVARERDLILQGIQAQQERPFSLVFDHMRRTLYGDHPYAAPVAGTIESVSRLTAADLRAYHQTYVRPDQMVVAIAGRMDPEAAQALVAQHLGDWQVATPLPDLPTVAVPPPTAPILVTQAQDTQQSLVMLGYLAPAAHHPDYIPLKLLATHLGSGMSSQLFVNLREKQGLAYEVAAFYATRLAPSPFVAYLGTAPHQTGLALQQLQQEFAQLRAAPLSDEAVAIAKRKVRGQYAMAKQTNGQLAQVFGWYEILGLGIAFDQDYGPLTDAVTAEQLQRVAQTYLVNPVIAAVGPAAALAQLSPAPSEPAPNEPTPN